MDNDESLGSNPAPDNNISAPERQGSIGPKAIRSLDQMPNVREYLNEHGLIPRAFNGAAIEIQDGSYTRETKSIRFAPDGTVITNHPELEPTEQQQKDIQSDFKSHKIPHSVPATKENLSSLPFRIKKENEGKDVFIFKDMGGDKVLMVERRFIENGRKKCVPYSYFGPVVGWLAMEPEGGMPIYGMQNLKPEAMTGKLGIMLHEGPKAAHIIQLLVDGKIDRVGNDENFTLRSEHPWLKELSDYVHIGWGAGALAPHRVNWKPLIDAADGCEIVMACDNDRQGKSAAGRVSKILKVNLKYTSFSEKFPPAWDLADAMPDIWMREIEDKSASIEEAEELFGEGVTQAAPPTKKIWTGYTLKDYYRVATWATEPYLDDRGKKGFRLADRFLDDVIYATSPETFVMRSDPTNLMDAPTFNTTFASFSDVDDLARLVRKQTGTRVDETDYVPSATVGIVENPRSKKLAINTYRPPEVKMSAEWDEPIDDGLGSKDGPTDTTGSGPKVFIKYMEQLIPDPWERMETLRWVATLVCRTDIKLPYALLLISNTQGVGKSTLAEHVIGPLIGRHNSKKTRIEDVIDSSFNNWRANTRLVLIEEANTTPAAGRKFSENIKDVITSDSFLYKEKYMKDRTVSCWGAVLATSNHERAIYLSDTDRRWLVPRLTQDLWGDHNWQNFYDWLQEDGLGQILGYLWSVVDRFGSVKPFERSPKTSLKEEIADSMLSDVQAGVKALFADMLERFPDHRWCVPEVYLSDWVNDNYYDGKSNRFQEKPSTLRNVVSNLDGIYTPSKRYKVDGPSRVIANWDIDPALGWPDIKPDSTIINHVKLEGRKLLWSNPNLRLVGSDFTPTSDQTPEKSGTVTPLHTDIEQGHTKPM